MEKMVDFLFVGCGVAPALLSLGGYIEAGGLLFVVLLLAGIVVSDLAGEAPHQEERLRARSKQEDRDQP